MSWSVSTRGKVADVKVDLIRQFSIPLAESPAGLSDEGERETVRQVRETILQCLGTFDEQKNVWVSANGHMSFDQWDSKTGANQTVSVSIQPVV